MSDALPNIKQPNLKDKVYELLLDMVVDGKYRDNDMLPPERILCEELGVSRTVVREAVKSLETRGVLKVIHGKGIKVIPATSNDISEAFMLYLRRKNRNASMKDLIEIRFSIETEIARYAALRARAEEAGELERIVDRMRELVNDFDEFIVADFEFHLRLAYIARNIIFTTVIEALVIPLMTSFKETASVVDNARSIREHAEIARCVKQNSADEARELMARHLLHVESMLREHGKL
jgi:GntR family transcriptional repressor for pyruvate dehydrogenase complex